MKKILFILAITVSLHTVAQNYEISTPSTSLVVCAPQGGDLTYKYYSKKLLTIDLQNIDAGRLGMEIQPKNMTEDEKNLCRKAIADYKRIRPIVQTGDIYRLHSPYDGDNLASLMYVSQDKTQAVFYWWKLELFVDEHLPRVKFAGLDPSRSYKITELNRIDNTPLPFEGMSFSGKYLMDNGLEIPYKHNVDYNKQNDWASRVLLLE